ncbi:hypothetical protein GCM10022252_66010 [Streptosporangium oxazolinicum]|uniref:DDE superfamily endonuclease n=1 Tax=Streptosporangium oxazolinicum TaxID=909287 RepID=A0ABP8BF56_9ACTN
MSYPGVVHPVLLPDPCIPRQPLQGRKSLSERDCIGPLDAVHRRLGAPIALVWDQLNAHASTAMKKLIAARDWLTVFLFPACTPEPNPLEGARSQCERSTADLVASILDRLGLLIRTRFERPRYRLDVLDEIPRRDRPGLRPVDAVTLKAALSDPVDSGSRGPAGSRRRRRVRCRHAFP